MRAVTFTPPLQDQIKQSLKKTAPPSRISEGMDPPGSRIVVIRHHAAGWFVEEVDFETRKCTGTPQQFLLGTDGAMKILPKYRWIADPEVVDVNSVKT
jgi:hypothetical protein